MRIHRCAMRHCRVKVAEELLMCGPHWDLVPTHLQKLVVEAYRPGQTGRTMTAEYLAAAKLAIRAAEANEGPAG